MWGRGPRGNNGTCSTLCWFSVTSPTTHKQSGPFWCWFPSGWVCVCSGTLWLSPVNSPVRLEVSPAAASTCTAVFNQWFEALFPHTGALGLHGLFRSPVVPPSLSAHECGTAGSTSHHLMGSTSCSLPASLRLARPSPPATAMRSLESSPPGCTSPPLLPVWVNVSSLTPLLSDFHTVWFSVSSGCFLFLSCCCPFGCARRHSVSTYTSILAGSPWYCHFNLYVLFHSLTYLTYVLLYIHVFLIFFTNIDNALKNIMFIFVHKSSYF